MQGVILNPSISNDFHCAILSVEQDQGLANFTLEEINRLFEFEASNLGDICRELTSYWGSIVRFDGIEVTCQLFSTKNNTKVLYLIFDDNLERLETRVTRLGYLFNQRVVLILPRCGNVRRYALHKQGNVFLPSFKERKMTDIDDVIHYYFRHIYQAEISEIKEYKVNTRFYGAGAMGKASLHYRGKSADKRLERIEIGQIFDINKEH